MSATGASSTGPRLLVLSSLFPSEVAPTNGLFIRERMFRVARHLPLEVVAPVPWFPLQGLLRLLRPGFRPMPARREEQMGITVHHPRFLSFPGVLKRLDGLSMALACYPQLRRIRKSRGVDIIDSHFAYPDGLAATLLGRWMHLPVTITLRGTEARLLKDRVLGARVMRAVTGATRVFGVADALVQAVVERGCDAARCEVVGNGVDTERFRPIDRTEARAQLLIAADAPVLVSVGGLVERKGFHRVIEVIPALREHWPDVVFLIVGSGGPEGNFEQQLKTQVAELGLEENVRFLGALPPDELRLPLSAADVFVLATRNEGWANVFLEAMACGLPVVTTRVGGNAEVVCSEALGRLVAFGDSDALKAAIADALEQDWDRARIREYAEANHWDHRIERLVAVFREMARA